MRKDKMIINNDQNALTHLSTHRNLYHYIYVISEKQNYQAAKNSLLLISSDLRKRNYLRHVRILRARVAVLVLR